MGVSSASSLVVVVLVLDLQTVGAGVVVATWWRYTEYDTASKCSDTVGGSGKAVDESREGT